MTFGKSLLLLLSFVSSSPKLVYIYIHGRMVFPTPVGRSYGQSVSDFGSQGVQRVVISA